VTVYLLDTVAAGDRPLEAWSLSELSELIECALAAKCPILRVGVRRGRPAVVRPLSPAEFRRLIDLLAH
jgi:hypothetical protein